MIRYFPPTVVRVLLLLLFVSSIVLFIFIFSAIEITECLHVSFTRLVGRGILSTTHTRASVYTSISQFTIGKEPKNKKEKELSFVCVCVCVVCFRYRCVDRHSYQEKRVLFPEYI